ncbi:DUF2141 domain-containing protein [Flavobacterium sp. HJJ]|uniref:DUF2141 domain-containing protein n=1 Tax=Flavobacterium sp. HJJ TaxID=2783792 RepID=UPI00188BA987|nr:DUF2141 domain-containing protein [Flavobacterium sp. HJJ]MBF4473025.1 DUF2141 domain-containing protein [Flavobacterium sp. HJJ]
MKIVLTILFFGLFSVGFAQTYDLTIKVPNVKNSKGSIHVSVYDSKNKTVFTKIGKEYRILDFKNLGTKGKYVIKDLPEGEYAIALYHDENDDKKCNTNMIGIPTEGYGFTNLEKIWSIPKFDDCKILLNKKLSVMVTLIY